MIFEVLARTALAVIVIILLVRINGLRSFAKMSSFEFALTIATGSLLASMIVSSGPPWPALVGLTALFAVRFAISKGRMLSSGFESATDNRPMFLFYDGVVLVYDGVVLDENLALARVTQAELMSKLRQANALDIKEVRAVVLESTGDISVLHGKDVSPELLEGVSWGRAENSRS